MKQVTAKCYYGASLYLLAEVYIDIGQVGIGHFVLAVAYHLIDAVRLVIANASYRS